MPYGRCLQRSSPYQPKQRQRRTKTKTRTWAPSVNVPERVSELGAPDGYTAGLAA
jgi:hypothetical protein